MTAAVTERGLGRATLARQFLLDRAAAPAIDAIEHLAGMQAQAPLAPYIGLWTRLRGFAPAELSALTEQRQVVRLHLMRNTVHLVSARDCLDWRALFSPLYAAQFSARFRRQVQGVDREALAGRARRLLEEQPRTRTELGRLPPRFLPAYDNLLLSHRDRSRVIRDGRPVPLPGNGATAGTFLVDGVWQGTWQVRDEALRIAPFTPLRPADADALLAEAAGLRAFLASAVTDIRLDPPQPAP